jgi:hydrogenase small subunit
MAGEAGNGSNGAGGRHLPRFTLDQGPIEEVHAFWLAGMSCDGCSVAAVGAQNPSVEQLVNGNIPGLPRVVLHHPVLAVTAGKAFMRPYELACEGKLGAPYVVCYEGSVPDEKIAHACGGYWSAMGVSLGNDGSRSPHSTAEWLQKLAPGAAAVIAVGTCATWGGIPAAAGNVTGSMSVMDLLGKDYLSALGLPPINIPGCSPIGDNITETITAILMFLAGVGPLPEFDELGRPAWMFGTTVHHACVRAGNYEEGLFAKEYGQKECLVDLGCWGPVVQCNITARGALAGSGGCMNAGGVCIGCTMPGFPDAFAPFYKAPPGATVSGSASRVLGSFMRPLRRVSQRNRNRTPLWVDKEVPTGWGRVGKPELIDRTVSFFYKKIQYYNTRFWPEGERQKALQASAHSYIKRHAEGREQLPEAAE